MKQTLSIRNTDTQNVNLHSPSSASKSHFILVTLIKIFFFELLKKKKNLIFLFILDTKMRG